VPQVPHGERMDIEVSSTFIESSNAILRRLREETKVLLTVHWPEARREIKLGAHQTKGSKGRTVILSTRVCKEIDAYLKTRATVWRKDHPLDRVTTLWASVFDCHAVNVVQGNLRDSGNSHIVSFRTTDICDSSERKGRGDADHSEADGTPQHRDNCIVLRRFRRDDAECGGVGVMHTFSRISVFAATIRALADAISSSEKRPASAKSITNCSRLKCSKRASASSMTPLLSSSGFFGLICCFTSFTVSFDLQSTNAFC
jgi:hypothetical protein